MTKGSQLSTILWCGRSFILTALGAIACAGCFIGGITRPATAAVVVQSNPFTVDTGHVSAGTTGGGGKTFAIAPFNQTLGTLTGVTATLSSSSITLSGSVDVSGTGNTGFSAFLPSVVATPLIPGPGGAILAANIPGQLTTSCNSNAAFECTGSNSTSSSGEAVSSVTYSPLSLFEGPTSIDLGPGLTLVAESLIIGPQGTPVTVNSAFADAVWTGTYDVTYTYTPASTAVPEPASLVLLLAGLGGLLGTRLLLRRTPYYRP